MAGLSGSECAERIERHIFYFLCFFALEDYGFESS